MLIKLTPKQEAFCLAYIETGNASEAYRQAYNAEKMADETIWVKACELLKSDKVSVRVAGLQEAHVERHNVTVDSLTDELDEARTLAIDKEQSAAAVSASMGKAKLHGLLTDKVQHSGAVDLATSKEWARVQSKVLRALKPYPEALKAVSDSLRTLEG